MLRERMSRAFASVTSSSSCWMRTSFAATAFSSCWTCSRWLLSRNRTAFTTACRLETSASRSSMGLLGGGGGATTLAAGAPRRGAIAKEKCGFTKIGFSKFYVETRRMLRSCCRAGLVRGARCVRATVHLLSFLF